MTTITFEQDIKIRKSRFKNILEFKKYLEDNLYFTELKRLNKNEITTETVKKMNDTKKLKKFDFSNV